MSWTWSLAKASALVLAAGLASCSAGGGGSGEESAFGEDGGSIAVTPQADLVSSGVMGGNFTPGAMAYTVTNQSGSDVQWTARVNQSWVMLSQTTGTLNPNETDTITVALNQAQVALLPAGQSSAQVTFIDLNTGASLTRDVTVNIEAVGAGSSDIDVVSAFGFGSIGEVGGPFLPGMKTYTVTNTGTAVLDWTAAVDVPWAALSSTLGQLAVGDSTGVTVTINQTLAAALPAGTHQGTISFTDTSSGKVEDRQIVLTITNGTPTVSVMLVDPVADQAVDGVVGGPFTPTSNSYTISNGGAADLNWTLSSNVPWLNLSATSGLVLPSGNQAISVSVDQAQAAALAVGVYTGVLTFTDTGTADVQTRTIILTVNATPVSDMTLTPETALNSTGEQGGPFSPSFEVYTVTNDGTAALDWTATADEPWVSLSSAGGQLAPGASFAVTVSIDQNLAGALPQGTQDAIVTFTDTGTAETEDRDVVLIITPPSVATTDLVLTPNTSFDSSGVVGGPFAPASQVYTLTNTGTDSIDWTAMDDQNWITLSTSGSTLAAGGTQTITVSINQSVASTLPLGNFLGILTVTDTDASVDLTRPVNLAVLPSGGGGSMASSVSQFGFTWTFDQPYLVGQFANADWWVVGPINVVGISPQSTSVSGRTRSGSELNPDPARGMTQGFDSDMYGRFATGSTFSQALNVGLGVSVASPLNVPVHTSLVSSLSHVESGLRPQLKGAAVLTVLPSAPPAGSFRPYYVGTDKSILFNESQLDYTKLGKLNPVGETPTLAQAERFFERPWIDHVAKFPGRYMHPSDNMEDYGRDLTSEISVGALMLNMNFTDAQKRDLLVRFVQLGIDLYGITQNGGNNNWEPAQGHGGGRKWPIMFAGMMLGDSAMSSVGFDPTIQFGEDGQTFYVAETSPGVYNFGFGGYNASDVGTPEWGGFHALKPSGDDKNWFGDVYRLCCTANAWWGILLSAYVMGAKGAWNHDALFDYQDRFRTENAARGITDFRNAWRDFDFEMYEAYRDNY